MTNPYHKEEEKKLPESSGIVAQYMKMSVSERVKKARESNITPEQAKKTKDIGGILVPRAFQVPNEIVDDGWIQELKESEFKVLIFLIRKTFGFNKIGGDAIARSQIIKGTGLGDTAVKSALKLLENVKLIRIVRRKKGDGSPDTNIIKLITRDDYSK